MYHAQGDAHKMALIEHTHGSTGMHNNDFMLDKTFVLRHYAMQLLQHANVFAS
jgi:hypothetical protein